MKRSIYGVLALALLLTVGLTLSSFAQGSTYNTHAKKQNANTNAHANAYSNANRSNTGSRNAMAMSPANQRWRAIAFLQAGGSDADQFQWGVLDSNIKTLADAVNQLHRLSSNPSQNAPDIVHWQAIRDESANRISSIVANYFLSQRLMPFNMQQAMLAQGAKSRTAKSANSGKAQPGMAGTRDEAQRKAYDKMLETAHEMLVQTYLAKQSSEPAHVQRLQKLASRLRQETTQQQHELQSEMKRRGINPQQGVQAFRGGPATGQNYSASNTPKTGKSGY